MRDAVMEALASEMNRQDTYEQNCPVCEECLRSITADDYYYEIYGTIICERCLQKYRHSVESYVEARMYGG